MGLDLLFVMTLLNVIIIIFGIPLSSLNNSAISSLNLTLLYSRLNLLLLPIKGTIAVSVVTEIAITIIIRGVIVIPTLF